jgi:hypothetical protein
MYTTQVLLDGSKEAPTVARAEFRYNSETGEIEHGYDADLPATPPVWTTEPGISPAPTELLTYWIRFDVLTGAVDTGSAATGTWIDAYSTAEDVDKFMQWYVASPGTSQAVTGTFTIAPDNGTGGTPDTDLSVTRNVSLTANQT